LPTLHPALLAQPTAVYEVAAPFTVGGIELLPIIVIALVLVALGTALVLAASRRNDEGDKRP
jgi:hypothetical protein